MPKAASTDEGWKKVTAHPFYPALTKLDDAYVALEDALVNVEGTTREKVQSLMRSVEKASDELEHFIREA